MKKLGKALVAIATSLAMGAVGFAGASTALAADGDATLEISSVKQNDEFTAFKLLDIESSAGCDTTVSVGVDPSSTDQGTNCKIVYKLIETPPELNAAIRTAAQAVDDTVNDSTDLLKWLTGDPQDPDDHGKLTSDNINAFAKAFTYTTGTDFSAAADGAVSQTVAPGYYLVKQTADGTKNDTDATSTRTLSRNMVTTALAGQTVTIALKNDSVPVGKYLDNPELNDGAEGKTDIASYAIGDVVDYVITGGIPSNYSDFDTFIFKFTDTLDPGLTFKANSLKIYFLDGEYVATGASKTDLTDTAKSTPVSYPDTGKKLAVTEPTEVTPNLVIDFQDLKQYGTAVNVDTTIVATYQATVNKNAQITNNNGVKIDFSYDPYTDGTISTPTVITTAVSFTLKVNKVDGAGESPNGLADAEFTLTRESDNGATKQEWIVSVVNKDGAWVATIPNLSAGKYTLSETKVPAGYNKAKDIEFKIVADYDDQDSLVKLTVMDKDGRTELTDTFTVTNVSGTVTTAEGGVLATTIKNVAGSQLPSTGGMGTTILYIIGGLIVLAAAGGLTVAVRKRQN